MTEKPRSSVFSTSRIVTTLRELISALDSRVPQVERPGENRIARDAQMLRREAVAQIEALSRREADDTLDDQELVDGIMTDDGCPAFESGTNTQSSGGVWKRVELPLIAPAADMLDVG